MAFTIDQFRLDGKVAIVTGAGGRGNSIGRAYALGFALAGASSSSPISTLKARRPWRTRSSMPAARRWRYRVDVADQDSTLAMAQAAVDAFGGIDILINNAAMMAELGQLTIADVPLDTWNKILSVNLTGAMLCAQAVIPRCASGGGRILNQTSRAFRPHRSTASASWRWSG